MSMTKAQMELEKEERKIAEMLEDLLQFHDIHVKSSEYGDRVGLANSAEEIPEY